MYWDDDDDDLEVYGGEFGSDESGYFYRHSADEVNEYEEMLDDGTFHDDDDD